MTAAGRRFGPGPTRSALAAASAARPRSGALDGWLCVVLALGGVLRFTGLAWGARHRPLGDESSFVEAVAQMLARGDLDHRFYEYPGLFLYLLVPGQWLAGGGDGFPATVAGRATVAAFGVASIALVYAVGHVLGGRGVALTAALLKAVCPLDVETAHMIRTDVVLEFAFLAGLLALVTPLRRRQRWARAGAALGFASAIKFSGPLLGLPIAFSALARRRRWLSSLGRSFAWAAVVFVVCSPYTLLNQEQARAGAAVQVRYHYQGRAEAPGYLENIGAYALRAAEALGPLWLALALAGVIAGRRRWRRLLPLAALPLAVLAVFATAEVRYDRFLVPTTGVLAVFAALGAQHLAGGAGWRLAGLALCAGAWPSTSSALDVRSYLQPTVRDRALDFMATAGPGLRVLSTSRELGIDPVRFALTRARLLDPWTRRLAREHDLVVVQADHLAADVPSLEEVRRIRPTRATAGQGPELVILRPRVPPSLAYEWLEVVPWSTESTGPTYRLPGLGGRDGVLEVLLPEAMLIDALEWVPSPTERRPPRLRLEASADGLGFTAVDGASERVAARADGIARRDEPVVRLLPLEPVQARALRLSAGGPEPLDRPASLRVGRPRSPRH